MSPNCDDRARRCAGASLDVWQLQGEGQENRVRLDCDEQKNTE